MEVAEVGVVVGVGVVVNLDDHLTFYKLHYDAELAEW